MDPNLHVEAFRGHNCHVIPLPILPMDPNHIPDLSSGDQYFSISVIKKDWCHQLPSGVPNTAWTNSTARVHHNIPKKPIEENIETILSTLNLPEGERSSFKGKILDVAVHIANKSNKDDKISYILVIIGVFIGYRNNHSYGRTLQASMEDQGSVCVPASNSSIARLERMEIEPEEELSNCVICLEDFKVCTEAIRMPCSQSFHQSCITNWLKHRNVCPLCRFQMPTKDD